MQNFLNSNAQKQFLRLIKFAPRSAQENMALDEVLFSGFTSGAILRTYTWDKQYSTIGYSQKNDCSAVRRLTGGLAVNHKDDVSYSFISSIENWKFVYSETNTYKNLHAAVQKALLETGFNCSFLESKQGAANNICLQTLCENDLLYNGKKVVGSCLRRRRTKILVQGSVHIKLDDKQKEIFHAAFAKAAANLMNLEIEEKDFSPKEIADAEILAAQKYANPAWNNKIL